MTERRRVAIAWVAFLVIVFGLLNAGLGHRSARAFEDRMRSRGITIGDAVAGARMLYTDEGDPQRYFAYASALLGRPCSGYYVRTEAAWRSEFDAGTERDPDLVPDRLPVEPLVPYRDFAVEYPPLFFVLVVPLAAVIDDADAFRVAFGVEMAVVLGCALVLTLRLARRLGAVGPTPVRLVGWMGAAALLLGAVVTHRFDGVVGLLLVGAVVATVEDRPVWAGVALGAAVGLKLMPIVVAPILALHWVVDRRWRALARGLAAGTLVVGITLGPLLAVDGGLVALVRYHATRPLQVESTWAAVLRLVDGSDLGVVHSYGSINVVGGHADIALAAMPFVLAGALAAVLVASHRRMARARDAAQRGLVVARGTIAILATCVTLGKVFSPQYLSWLLPLGVLVALVDGRRAIAAFAIILLLTQIIYPIGNPALEAGATWMSALVLVRNFALLGWAVMPLVRS